MENNHTLKVKQLLQEGYSFEPGQYISSGFDIFRTGAGNFIGYLIVSYAMMFMTGLIPFLGLLANAFIEPALTAGWFIVARKIVLKQQHEFNDFFKGFESIVQLFVASLIQGIIIAAILFAAVAPFMGMLALSALDIGNLQSSVRELLIAIAGMTTFFFAIFIAALPVIYLSVAWSFTPFFIVFLKMDFWEAMESSRKIITKKWFSFFIFFFLLVLINLFAMIPLGLGLLVTIPASYCAMYAAFHHIVKPEEESAADESMEEHLITN